MPAAIGLAVHAASKARYLPPNSWLVSVIYVCQRKPPPPAEPLVAWKSCKVSSCTSSSKMPDHKGHTTSIIACGFGSSPSRNLATCSANNVSIPSCAAEPCFRYEATSPSAPEVPNFCMILSGDVNLAKGPLSSGSIRLASW